MANMQVWPDEIQPVENLCFVPVERRYLNILAIRIVLVYGVIMAAAILCRFLDFYGDLVFYLIEGGLAVLLAVNLFLVRKIYRVRGYALRDKDISYRCGLFFTRVDTIPFSKIQQVSVSTNPLGHIFNLYYLEVFNGSQSDRSQIVISGLTKERAESIKSFLLKKEDSENA